ncbi:MAG: hypothetical protein HQ485_11950 [Acidobacteria bacterium]|nr:hypothetical protein [Acidobacteriota bacterium]
MTTEQEIQTAQLMRQAHLFDWHYMPVAVMTLVAFAVGSWSGRSWSGPR